MMNRIRGRGAAFWAVLALMVGVACGDDGQQPALRADVKLADDVPTPFEASGRQAERTFVGEVGGSGLWVAVVANGDEALAFFCDGERTWGLLEGEVSVGQLRLDGKDARLEGRLSGGRAVARLAIGGTTYQVDLAQAIPGTSGLYRATADDSVTWWIQTPSGLKGATAEGGSTKGFQTADAQGFETNTAAGGSGGGSRRRR